jgi:hypothetical protein
MTKTDWEQIYECSICGDEQFGYGNNAWPLNDGRCCDNCNAGAVIPTRIRDWLCSIDASE